MNSFAMSWWPLNLAAAGAWDNLLLHALSQGSNMAEEQKVPPSWPLIKPNLLIEDFRRHGGAHD